MILEDIRIENCRGGGIRCDAPVQAKRISIRKCGGVGVEMSTAASKVSSWCGVQISDCQDGVLISDTQTTGVPREVYDEAAEAVRGASGHEDAVSKLKSSGLGRWLREQKFTDWARLVLKMLE